MCVTNKLNEMMMINKLSRLGRNKIKEIIKKYGTKFNFDNTSQFKREPFEYFVTIL